jgi:hypothetical protein
MGYERAGAGIRKKPGSVRFSTPRAPAAWTFSKEICAAHNKFHVLFGVAIM